jgi:hypothetical protein
MSPRHFLSGAKTVGSMTISFEPSSLQTFSSPPIVSIRGDSSWRLRPPRRFTPVDLASSIFSPLSACYPGELVPVGIWEKISRRICRTTLGSPLLIREPQQMPCSVQRIFVGSPSDSQSDCPGSAGWERTSSIRCERLPTGDSWLSGFSQLLRGNFPGFGEDSGVGQVAAFEGV